MNDPGQDLRYGNNNNIKKNIVATTLSYYRSKVLQSLKGLKEACGNVNNAVVGSMPHCLDVPWHRLTCSLNTKEQQIHATVSMYSAIRWKGI